MKVEDQPKKPGDAPGGNDSAAKKETFHQDRRQSADARAEVAVRGFLAARLDELFREVESALDGFEAWAASQSPEVRTALDQNGFFAFLGGLMEQELAQLAGGFGRPFADVLVREVHNATSWAEHSSVDLGNYIDHAFRSGVRHACWYLRDAAPAILADQWEEVLSLAAGGGNQFIAAFYALGIPTREWKPLELTERLKLNADAYRQSLGLATERIAARQPEGEKTVEQLQEQAQREILQSQEKKPAALA